MKFYLLSYSSTSHTYCRDKSGIEGIVGETEQDTSLPDPRVSN